MNNSCNGKNLNVQLVGVPGAGKSFLMGRIGLTGIRYIEFGKELKEWISRIRPGLVGCLIPPRDLVKGFLEKLTKDGPTLFTSHLASYEREKWVYDLDLEVSANSAGYIYVFSDARDILSRRRADNDTGIRIRPLDDLGRIEAHRDTELRFTQEVARTLGSRFLRIDNLPGRETENLGEIRRFLGEVLLDG